MVILGLAIAEVMLGTSQEDCDTLPGPCNRIFYASVRAPRCSPSPSPEEGEPFKVIPDLLQCQLTSKKRSY